MKRHALLSYAILIAIASSVHATVFIDEQFSYSNGDLTSVSGGTWAAHSAGGSGPIQVLDGSAIVKFDSSEDVNRFTGGPSLDPGDTWYYGIQFSIKDLRTTADPLPTDYFAHIKDAGTANLRARLYLTAGSTPDTYKLGITSSSGTLTQIWASNLEFDTTYHAVVSYTASLNDPRAEIPVNPVNPFDGQGNQTNPTPSPLSGQDGWASLWVSPTSEASTKITDTAPAENVGNDLRSEMDSIALRQASSSFPGSTTFLEFGVSAFVLGDDFNQVLDLVEVELPGTPGDFDGDDDVDGNDFLVWQRNTSVGNLSDWQTNYGTGIGPLSTVTAVPEPNSIAFVGIGLALSALGIRRK
jgi:hypothetical protein